MKIIKSMFPLVVCINIFLKQLSVMEFILNDVSLIDYYIQFTNTDITNISSFEIFVYMQVFVATLVVCFMTTAKIMGYERQQ